MRDWIGVILTLGFTALLAPAAYFGTKRQATPTRARVMASGVVLVGLMFAGVQAFDLLGLDPARFRSVGFFFRVLLPVAGSLLEWNWLVRMGVDRLRTGATVQDLGRTPGWTFAFMALSAAIVLVSSPEKFGSVPIYVFAASSVIAAVIRTLGHVRITENGLWSGHGFVEWSGVEQWYFRKHEEKELLQVKTNGGLFDHDMIIQVSEAQKSVLEPLFLKRLPHLQKRELIVAKS